MKTESQFAALDSKYLDPHFMSNDGRQRRSITVDQNYVQYAIRVNADSHVYLIISL